MKIQLLEEHTINQIAAGEVIENPASVIKELIENAIDAGSTQISVETRSGGLAWIEISDNGSGMLREDLLLSIERHATSKIRAFEDLSLLTTLGFRGEALSSIASVSKLSITTRVEEASEGLTLTAEGGKVQRIEPASRQRGTTILVRSLFYNVPVRRKFLKSLSQEVLEIQKLLMTLALAYPEIQMRWVHEDQEQFLLKKVSFEEGYAERLYTLLGQDCKKQFIPLCIEREAFRLEGYISLSSFHRPNRTGQHLFLNKRPTLCPLISSMILEGYGTSLPKSRYPSFVLHMQLPPHWVDVNVHPQKKEVRLRETGEIRQQILKSIERALQKSYTPPLLSASLQRSPPLPSPTLLTLPAAPVKYTLCTPPLSEQPEIPVRQPIPIVGIWRGQILVDGATLPRKKSADWQEALLSLNPSRATARVRYETLLKKRLAGKSMESQALLLPLNYEASREKKMWLNTFQELLHTLGFSFRPLSGSTFLFDALPLFLEREDLASALEKISELLQVSERGKEPSEEEIHRLLIPLTQSYRGSKMKIEQAPLLLEELFQCDIPWSSPQGEPIFSLLTHDLKATHELL